MDSDLQFLLTAAAFVAILLFLYRRLVAGIWSGQAWRAVVLVWLTSPVMLSGLAVFGEDRPFSDFLELGDMPWSLIIGDVVVLPSMAFVAARSASDWRDQSFAIKSSVRRLCLAAGLAAGLAFHLYDGAGYRVMKLGNLVASLTKVYHDLVIYPVLFGALLFAGIMVVRFAQPNTRRVFLLLLAAWVMLVVLDANRGLNPNDFHTPCDVTCGVGNLSDRGHDIVEWLREWLRRGHLMN